MRKSYLQRRFGAELRKMSRRVVEEEVPAPMLDRLRAIREAESKAASTKENERTNDRR